MRVDARPFFFFTTQAGKTKGLRPEFNGRAVGVGGSGESGTVNVVATHTMQVFRPFAADLKVGVMGTIDDTEAAGRYRVLVIAENPAGAMLYLSNDPAQTGKPYQPDTTGTPRTGQKLPYLDGN